MTIGFIYVISSPSTDKIYVGSTIKKLYKRFSEHKSLSATCSSKEIIKYGNAEINLVEEVEFIEKEELLWIEREYLELWKNDCVNKYNPIITEDEDKDRRKEKHKNYSINNRGKLNDCQRNYTKRNREKVNEKARERYHMNKNLIIL